MMCQILIIQDSYNSLVHWVAEGSSVKVLLDIISAISFLDFTLFYADCLYSLNFQIVVVGNTWLGITERCSY